MTKRRLVIDDARTFNFPEAFTFYCRNIFSAYNAIKDHTWDEIYWDYDMGLEGGGDTIALARFVVANGLAKGNPVMYVHSSNPVGAGQLMSILEEHWTTVRLPTGAVR